MKIPVATIRSFWIECIGTISIYASANEFCCQLTDKVVTGSFDAENFLCLSQHQQHERGNTNSSLSISLKFPDISGDSGENDELNFSFDCHEGTSNDQSHTSFYVCSDENQRRNLRVDGTFLPPTKTYIGMDGAFVSGLVVSPSTRYEIRTHLNCDGCRRGGVSYSYAATLSQDTF